MAISREDQNTFLMILGVMMICVIALCAVFNTIWQIIGTPVSNFVNNITTSIRLQTLNYNFDIPNAETIPDPTPIEPVFPSEIKSYTDALYTFSELNTITLAGGNVNQKELRISISSIGSSANVYQGEPSEELLKKGFWVSPTENELGEGEVVIFCNRRFFGPDGKEGCWNIEKIQRSDLIQIVFEGINLEYQVIGINTFNADDPLIYQVNTDQDLVKLITTHPLESNLERLVVLAERVR